MSMAFSKSLGANSVMQNAADRARLWVLSVLDAKGWNQNELAHKAGLSPSTVSRILDNPPRNVPRLSTLWRIEEAARMPMPQDVLHAFKPTLIDAEAPDRITVPSPQEERLTPLPGGAFTIISPSQSLKVYGRMTGKGYECDFTKPEGEIPRPAYLAGRDRAYAVYVPDSSMEPIYRTGGTLYVDPSRPPALGDDVWVVYGITHIAMVRRLLEFCDEGPRLGVVSDRIPRGFDTSIIPASRIASMHMVVGSTPMRL